MSDTRDQLSLFVGGPDGWRLNALRWIRQTRGGPWQTIARFSLGPAPR